MESLAYIVTNKFILVAVDSRLELRSISGADSKVLKFDQIRKAHKISERTLISILGLPSKITDLYKYILGIKNSDKSYDSIIEDLNSIYNSDVSSIINKIQKVKEIIHKYNDGHGVLNQSDFLKHFEKDPDLLDIAKEALSLEKTNTATGTQILLFSRENNKNHFGIYLAIGTNFTGSKVEEIPKDNFFFNIVSSQLKQNKLDELRVEKTLELQADLTTDWELSEELIMNFKEKCKSVLSMSILKMCTYETKPNVVFYELSSETEYKFKEPNMNLVNINFNRE